MAYIYFLSFYDISLPDCNSILGIKMYLVKSSLFEIYESFLCDQEHNRFGNCLISVIEEYILLISI